jgi:FtsH-binding integral membrane protein
METMQIIGWFFLAASLVALGIGAFLVATLSRTAEDTRRHLAANAWNEAVIFGIWIAGLAGSIGVLRGESWGRFLLQLFCWILIALVGLTAAQRGRLAWKAGERASLLGIGLFTIPIVLACGAAIIELRSPGADAWFRR